MCMYVMCQQNTEGNFHGLGSPEGLSKNHFKMIVSESGEKWLIQTRNGELAVANRLRLLTKSVKRWLIFDSNFCTLN